MDPGNLLVVAIPVIFGLALLLVVATARARRRSDISPARRPTRPVRQESGPTSRQVEVSLTAEAEARYAGLERALSPTDQGTGIARRGGGLVGVGQPATPEELGLTRRQLFNRAMVYSQTLSYAGFGAAVLAFLWPSQSGGFGGKVLAGNLDDILAEIAEKRAPYYVPSARSYVIPYPKQAVSKGKAVYKESLFPGMDAGIMALWQKCPHLGCRVPWCASSQWFECPCHGSKYNRVGEKKDGPAPRGMDRFPVEIVDGRVVINTGLTLGGPAIGVDTTGQGAEGPACF
ncbi:MAG: ubiquinol-cytochrome c reductase iron-sulfur subunit [Acidimicrobiia bacterium]